MENLTKEEALAEAQRRLEAQILPGDRLIIEGAGGGLFNVHMEFREKAEQLIKTESGKNIGGAS